jgi:hypothetical protein
MIGGFLKTFKEQHAPWKHQSCALACGSCQQEGANARVRSGGRRTLNRTAQPAGELDARSTNHAREEAGASPRGLGDAVPARRTSRLRNGR